MAYVFINGTPINVYPKPHLADIAEVEDVEFEEIEND